VKKREAIVVDDDAASRCLSAELLEAAGWVVHQAGGVRQALELLATTAPEVALFDVEMPEGGGLRLLRELRARPDTAKLPVLAVTALAMAGDRDRLLAAGFDGYITKPVDARRFAGQVDAVIAQKARPT
jgi:CheY-like chemotaxis protein